MTNKNTAAVNRGPVSSLALLPALRGHVKQELLRCGPQNIPDRKASQRGQARQSGRLFRRCSSVVEQRSPKPRVGGSIPSTFASFVTSNFLPALSNSPRRPSGVGGFLEGV